VRALTPCSCQRQALGPRFRGGDDWRCCQFDYNRLRGDDEQGGVPHANFRNEVLVRCGRGPSEFRLTTPQAIVTADATALALRPSG
jgi:hypothetical protein